MGQIKEARDPIRPNAVKLVNALVDAGIDGITADASRSPGSVTIDFDAASIDRLTALLRSLPAR